MLIKREIALRVEVGQFEWATSSVLHLLKGVSMMLRANYSH